MYKNEWKWLEIIVQLAGRKQKTYVFLTAAVHLNFCFCSYKIKKNTNKQKSIILYEIILCINNSYNVL